MFCTHCGNELPENARFCPACGNGIENNQQTETADTEETVVFIPEIENDPYEAEKSERGGSILKFAIMGLAFMAGSGGFLSILGLIFTIIARSKVNEYVRDFGATNGRATVGKHLTIPGLITNIFFMVFWFIYFLLIIAAVASTI